MKKILKYFFIVVLLALVGIQFIPANVNKQEYIPYTDIRYVYDVPDKIMNILENSCYDCHSNNTNYPWYSHIQPIRLIMDNHIKEGKKKLNFSEFSNYSNRRKKNKLKTMAEQIKKKKMPLPSYLWMHPEATINQTKLDTILLFLLKCIYK